MLYYLNIISKELCHLFRFLCYHRILVLQVRKCQEEYCQQKQKEYSQQKQKEEGNGIQRTALVLCDSRRDPTNDRKIPISINEKLGKLRRNSRRSANQKVDFGGGGILSQLHFF